MSGQVFADVWDAIESSPADALNMTLRSRLMSPLVHEIEAWTLTQAEAARRLGVTQPRLNDLLRGRIDKFSLDALVNLTAAAGLRVELQVKAA